MLLPQEFKTSRFRDKFGVEGAVEAIQREKIGNCGTSRHFLLCFSQGACFMCAGLPSSMLQLQCWTFQPAYITKGLHQPSYISGKLNCIVWQRINQVACFGILGGWCNGILKKSVTMLNFTGTVMNLGSVRKRASSGLVTSCTGVSRGRVWCWSPDQSDSSRKTRAPTRLSDH